MMRTPALICNTEDDGTPLGCSDFSKAPSEMLSDARRVAKTIYGRSINKAASLVDQMVALYLMTESADIAIIFNPGGWGWARVSQMPLWATILIGMKDVLEKAGQRVVTLNYLRSPRSLAGQLGEVDAIAKLSRAKGRELAARVEHLIRHRPSLKVILAGESNGAAMAEDALRFLRNNLRVFSVQTGTPFWAPSKPHPRSLIINHNGVEPDSFSSGNVRRWTEANVKAIFGRYKSTEGNILFHISAPGHVYSWDYPVVQEKITEFLLQTVISKRPRDE